MDLIKYDENSGTIIVAEDFIEEVIEFETLKAEIELKEKQFKEALLNTMEKYNITSWKTNDGSIEATYKKGTTRKTIDSTRLKKELPDVAEEYSKVSDVKASVALTINI